MECKFEVGKTYSDSGGRSWTVIAIDGQVMWAKATATSVAYTWRTDGIPRCLGENHYRMIPPEPLVTDAEVDAALSDAILHKSWEGVVRPMLEAAARVRKAAE